MEAGEITPDIVFDRVNVATCSLCGCEIDVTGIDPFVQIECPDCGSMEKVPAQLGPFYLLDLLGTGGMGGVYKARDIALGRLVGIKVMLSSCGEDAAFIETFRREAQAAARLNHPNVAQIYSFGQEKGQPYIVMELVNGQHFDKMVDQEKFLDQGTIIKVCLDIALGLQAADEIGLIHGDIKPENILLDEKMNAKLVDFGIASFAHQGSQDGIWGTPYYICPEKIRKQKVDARSDIYSLGATIFHAVTKHPPFDGETPIEVVKARLEGPPPPLSKYRKDVHPKVQQIVSRMLELEPSKRYPNYSSLISDMKKAVQELGGPRKKLGQKGKKVVIAKSKRSTSDQGPASEKYPAVKTGSTVRTGKKTIRTTRGSIKKTAIRTKRSTAAPKDSAAETPAAADADNTEESAQSAIEKYKQQPSQTIKQKKKGGVAGLIIGLSLVLVALGVGIVLFVMHKKEEARLAAVELATLNDRKARSAEAYASMASIASNIASIAESAIPYKEKANEACLIVTGSGYIQDAAPAEKKAAPADAPAETPKPKAPEPEVKKSSEGFEMPAGMPTREELEAKRAREAGQAEEPEAAAAPEPVAEAAAPEPEPESPVLDHAKAIFGMVDKLEVNSQEANGLLAEALGKKGAVEAARISTDATAKLEILNSDLETVKAIEENSKTISASLEETFALANELKLEKEEEIAAIEKARKEEEERIRREEQERIEAEQYAALVKSELELAGTAAKMNLTPIMQLNFDEAIQNVELQVRDYKSKEGKEAIVIILERYKRLKALKQYVIDSVNAKPYRWGYGKGTRARDIVGADEKGLKISGVADKVMWESVSTPQFLKIINHYLAEKSGVRKRGEANLNTAIYIYEIGKENDAALKKAREFAETSYMLCEDLEEQVDRLLPDL